MGNQVQIQVTDKAGAVSQVGANQGNVVNAEQGLKYVVKLNGAPLPAEAEVIREGDDLLIKLGDEVLATMNNWCQVSDAEFVWNEDGTSVVTESSATVLSGSACALMAGPQNLGTLAAAGATTAGGVVAAGAAVAGAASTFGDGTTGEIAYEGSVSGKSTATGSSAGATGSGYGFVSLLGVAAVAGAVDSGGASPAAMQLTASVPDNTGSAQPASVTNAAVTDDNTPTISGQTAPGATVTVKLASGEVLTTVADANGSWSVEPTQPLADGKSSYTVDATAPNGATAQLVGSIVIESATPAEPVAVLDPASDSGIVGDSITNDNTPSVQGSDATPGDMITVTTPVGEVLTTVVDAAGNWSVTPTEPLPDGLQNFSVVASNDAGKESAPVTVPVTIDTEAPTALAPILDPSSDSGTAGDNTTNDNTPMISGAESVPGDTITVTMPGGEVLTTNVAADGTWAVTPTVELPDGANVVSVTATDPAGNVSAPATVDVIIDTTAPDNLAPVLDPSSDSGTVGDSTTSDNTPTISGGDSTPGDTITVTMPTGEVLTTTVTAKGTWAVTPEIKLPDGTHTVSATATDPDGNVSAPATVDVIIDTAAPAALTPVLDLASDSGVQGDSITNDNTPAISGSNATPGDTITVTGPRGEVLSTVVEGNGEWVVTPTTELPDGTHTFSVTATDPAGNVSEPATVDVIIDTVAPASLTALLDPSSDSGVEGDNITNDNTPTISGIEGTPGDTITVTMPTGEVLTTVVEGQGQWSVTPTTELPDGLNVVSVTATDPAGNVTSKPAVVNVTVDTVAPDQLVPVLDPLSDTDPLGDGITTDTTPTISGTGASIGDIISVSMPTGEVLSAAVSSKGGGIWALTPTVELAVGTHEITATAMDTAGNISTVGTANITIAAAASRSKITEPPVQVEAPVRETLRPIIQQKSSVLEANEGFDGADDVLQVSDLLMNESTDLADYLAGESGGDDPGSRSSERVDLTATSAQADVYSADHGADRAIIDTLLTNANLGA